MNEGPEDLIDPDSGRNVGERNVTSPAQPADLKTGSTKSQPRSRKIMGAVIVIVLLAGISTLLAFKLLDKPTDPSTNGSAVGEQYMSVDTRCYTVELPTGTPTNQEFIDSCGSALSIDGGTYLIAGASLADSEVNSFMEGVEAVNASYEAEKDKLHIARSEFMIDGLSATKWELDAKDEPVNVGLINISGKLLRVLVDVSTKQYYNQETSAKIDYFSFYLPYENTEVADRLLKTLHWK